MSFLENLLHELQDQLVPADSAISAGQVAESATSERLNVTLPGGIMSRLKQQALQEGRSCSSLATFLIEDGLRRHTVIR
ncbi:MAG: CopG family transcriptional regulator [Synechococcus sp. ChSW.bin.154]